MIADIYVSNFVYLLQFRFFLIAGTANIQCLHIFTTEPLIYVRKPKKGSDNYFYILFSFLSVNLLSYIMKLYLTFNVSFSRSDKAFDTVDTKKQFLTTITELMVYSSVLSIIFTKKV